MPRTIASLVLAGLLATGALAAAQDMEPRAYSASPVGANFLVVSRSTGAVLLDPAIVITDVHADANTFALGLGPPSTCLASWVSCPSRCRMRSPISQAR